MSDPETSQPSQGADDTEQPDRGVGVGIVALVLIVLVMVVLPIGSMILDDWRNERLLEEGVPAKARVTNITPTGDYHNDQPEVRISLEVTPDGEEAFDAKVETYMSPVYLPRFQPGLTVDVRFDPKKHRNVALVGP